MPIEVVRALARIKGFARDAALELGLLTPDGLDALVRPEDMTRPGRR